MKYRPIFLTIILILLFACGAHAAIKVGQEKYYAVYWSDKLVGCSHYFVSQSVYMGGKKYYRVNSDSRLKAGMGAVEDVQFISDAFIDEKTYLPASLNLLQQSKTSRINIHTIISETLILQTNIIAKKQNDYMKEIKTPVNLFTNNFWGEFNTFVEQFQFIAERLSGSDEKVFGVYDPLMRSIQDITAVKSGEEKIVINNKEQTCKVYKILDSNKTEKYKIFLNDTGVVLKVEELNGALSMVISTPEAAKEIEKSKGVDLWGERVAETNFIMPNAQDLSFLKIKLNATVFGNLIKDYKTIGFRQRYYLETSPEEFGDIDIDEELENKQPPQKSASAARVNNLDGIFEVRTNDVVIQNSFKFPVTENFDEKAKKYLLPEFGIELDDEEIKNKANYVVLKSKDVWTAINKIFAWIKEEIKMGPAMPSARLTFQSRQGNSESISMLFAAMARNVGIPCRLVGGIIYTSGSFVPHTWVECYVRGGGWVAVDPALTEIEKISACHIALWHGGDIEKPKIKILEFAPNPAGKVAYFRSDIKWPLGEERKYKITKDEKEVGEEIVTFKGFSIAQDLEVGDFESLLSVKDENGTFTAKAKFYLDPYGLPVSYKLEMDNAKEKVAEECYFNKNFATKIVKHGKDVKEVSIPVSEGAYLADTRILSQICVALGQLPDVQMGKKYKIHLFSPDDLKTTAIDIKVDNAEFLNVNTRQHFVFVGGSEKMNFWIDKEGRIIKLEFPEQKLAYQLESYRNSLQK